MASVDSFESSRNKPRWQYATFIAALCHDLGKLFEMDLRIGDTRWRPFAQPYLEFVRHNPNHRLDLEIRFVADPDRDSTEKDLEGNPRLLRYRARPQAQFPVRHRPSMQVLKHLRPLQIHKTEVNRMHDSVVTINNTHWPAYRKENDTLVDLRLFDPTDRSPKPRLIFRPDKLRELGIPAALIDAAAKSGPQGLILFEDLPGEVQRANGNDDQATTEQSAT